MPCRPSRDVNRRPASVQAQAMWPVRAAGAARSAFLPGRARTRRPVVRAGRRRASLRSRRGRTSHARPGARRTPASCDGGPPPGISLQRAPGRAGAVADQDHRPVVVGRVEVRLDRSRRSISSPSRATWVSQPLPRPRSPSGRASGAPAVQRVGGSEAIEYSRCGSSSPRVRGAGRSRRCRRPARRARRRAVAQRQQVAGAALAVRVESFAALQAPGFVGRRFPVGRSPRPASRPDDAASGAARRRRRYPRRRGRCAPCARSHSARSRRTARIRCRPAPARRSAGPKVAAPRRRRLHQAGEGGGGVRADRRRCWPRTARVRSRASQVELAGARRARPGRRRAVCGLAGQHVSAQPVCWRARTSTAAARAAVQRLAGPRFAPRALAARRQARIAAQHSTTPAGRAVRRGRAFKIARPAPEPWRGGPASRR